jgi:hypothetical protein
MKKYVIVTKEGNCKTVEAYDILDAVIKSEINSMDIHSILQCSVIKQ